MIVDTLINSDALLDPVVKVYVLLGAWRLLPRRGRRRQKA